MHHVEVQHTIIKRHCLYNSGSFLFKELHISFQDLSVVTGIFNVTSGRRLVNVRRIPIGWRATALAHAEYAPEVKW